MLLSAGLPKVIGGMLTQNLNNPIFMIAATVIVASAMGWMFSPLTAAGQLVRSPRAILFSPWRVLTYGFLHKDLGHLVFNLLSLVSFGQILLATKGVLVLILVLLSGVILPGVVSGLLTPDNGEVPVVGLSCGVFAVMGFVAHATPKGLLWLYGFTIPMGLGFQGLMLVSAALSLKGGGGVWHFGHLLGGITGWVFFSLVGGK